MFFGLIQQFQLGQGACIAAQWHAQEKKLSTIEPKKLAKLPTMWPKYSKAAGKSQNILLTHAHPDQMSAVEHIRRAGNAAVLIHKNIRHDADIVGRRRHA